MKLYRYTIGMYHGNKTGIENINDEDILFQYSITSPDTMIRVARLSLWSRILCKAPEVVKSLCFDMAKVNVGWPSAVYGDLKWACGANFFQAAVGRSFEDWA